MRISLDEACERLHQGQVIAIPTETVYGLAALYSNPVAVQAMFALKQRPQTKPLSLLFSKFDQLHPLVAFFPSQFLKLKGLMPGPITVVIEANCQNVPAIVRAHQSTIGLRMPQHHLALKLLDRVGPLAVPSANPSGQAPARTFAEVEKYFGTDFPVVDGGLSALGEPSTVIQIEREGYKILRQGALSTTELQQILGSGSV